MATELTTHHKYAGLNKDDGEEDEDSAFDEDEGDLGRAETIMSRTFGDYDLELKATDDTIKDTLSGNPKNWHWQQIQLWLRRKKFDKLIEVFNIQHAETMTTGIEGEEFLDMTLVKLYDHYPAEAKLGISRDRAESDPMIERFFRFD